MLGLYCRLRSPPPTDCDRGRVLLLMSSPFLQACRCEVDSGEEGKEMRVRPDARSR